MSGVATRIGPEGFREPASGMLTGVVGVQTATIVVVGAIGSAVTSALVAGGFLTVNTFLTFLLNRERRRDESERRRRRRKRERGRR